MADFLKSKDFTWQVVYSSDALRAKSTAYHLAKDVELCSDLYTFDWRAILHFVKMLDDKYSDVLIVGHNPALTDITNYVAGEAIENIPTCGFVQIQCDVLRWNETRKNSGKLSLFEFPKNVLKP